MFWGASTAIVDNGQGDPEAVKNLLIGAAIMLVSVFPYRQLMAAIRK